MKFYSKPGIIQNKMPAEENCSNVDAASTTLLTLLFLDFVSEKGIWSHFFFHCLSPQNNSAARIKFTYMEDRTEEPIF